SPGFGAGRYVSLTAVKFTPAGFNPRPALGPGATQQITANASAELVSILARLWGRALPRQMICADRQGRVSILARLWGRALLPAIANQIQEMTVSILARLWGRALLFR